MRILPVFAASLMACAALLFTSCDMGVEHTGDETGALYGNWELDTKTVDIQYTSGGKGENSHEETSFAGDHFYLGLTENRLAFAKEGSILSFDIDDLDAVTFSYNANQKRISFDKALSLSKGILNPKVMLLLGTYDVKELTQGKLVLSKEENVVIGEFNAQQATVYSFHRVSSSQ